MGEGEQGTADPGDHAKGEGGTPGRPIKQQLYEALKEAHQECARRQCSSTVILKEAYMANGFNATAAVAAACCSLGGPHAPITHARRFLDLCVGVGPRYIPSQVFHLLNENLKIPGWGCSFTKQQDPIWGPVRGVLIQFKSGVKMLEAIQAVTGCLHLQGIKIHPNAAIYTAACSRVLGYTAETAPMLVLDCRIDEWRRILQEIPTPSR